MIVKPEIDYLMPSSDYKELGAKTPALLLVSSQIGSCT
jgi:hypothetical protein